MQENYHLDLVCRDDSTLNFRINLYALNKTGTNATTMAQNGKDLQIFTIYVIKLHIYNNAEKYFIFLVSLTDGLLMKKKKDFFLCDLFIIIFFKVGRELFHFW